MSDEKHGNRKILIFTRMDLPIWISIDLNHYVTF